MRRLLLLRHGKSAWDSGAVTDHLRPLKKRGRESSRAVGRRLAELGWVPDVVLCSDAKRATETLAEVQEGLGDASDRLDVRIVPELYLGGLAELAGACRGLTEDAPTVLAIGHNPGFEEAAVALTGQPVTLKTADLAVIQLDSAGADPASGARLEEGTSTLEAVWRSRELL